MEMKIYGTKTEKKITAKQKLPILYDTKYNLKAVRYIVFGKAFIYITIFYMYTYVRVYV